MTELEQALVALGRELDVPAGPDLRRAVRERIERRRARRRWIAVAAALAVVALGIAFAVPEARSAILRFFHIGAATVERVETLPAAEERPLSAGLGPVRSRDEAERVAGFDFKLPPFEGNGPRRFYAWPGLGAVLFRAPERVLLVELEGDQLSLTKKYAAPATVVRPALVNGAFALWIEGAPHVVMYLGPPGQRLHRLTTRMAGNVLLWADGDRTYRLEGKLSKRRAIELAERISG
jgi:hypothetical protein